MLAATHTAYAQEAARVEFALADFPPYFQIDERNEPSGPVLELVAALFAEAEQPHVVRGYPAARLYQRLERGETAVSMGGAGHPEMARTSLRGSAPIFTVELNIYRKPQQPQVRQPAELAGLSVAEAGKMLGISVATAYRHWSYARAWLHCELLRGES